MTDSDVLKVISDNFLCVRRLPFKVISLWSYREGDEDWLKDNQVITQIPEWGDRKFVREEKVVEKGGWWYIKEVKNTDSTVMFNRENDKFFAPTIKEAVKLYLKSKK